MSRGQEFVLQTLFWEATLRCNAFCDFCGSRCGEVRSEEVSKDEVRRVFRKVSEAYDPSQIMINVTGGEPLLRQDLFEVMEYAKELGFPWGMVTNGSLVTAKIVEKMRKSGMKTISVSLDGMMQTHEALRKIPDGFSKVTEAVRMLREADFLDHIQITTVVNQKNLPELEMLYEHLLTLGVDSWRLALIDPIGRAQDQSALLADTELLKEYLAFLEAHQFHEKLRVTTSCSHYLGKADNIFRSHAFSCEAGKRVASILANGDIFVCPNVERRPELIQGNIRTDSFVDVWENRFEWFRREANRRRGPCSACDAWDKCRGDSLHTWDFQNERPRFCIRELCGEPEGPGGLLRKPGNRREALPRMLIEKLKKQAEPLRGIRISFGSTSGKCVYFTPNASEELYHYFYWNRNHPRNLCELMAGLAGHVQGDDVFVELLLPVFLEERGRKEAAFSRRSFELALEELRIVNDCRKEADGRLQLFEEPFELVGFAHTHPGELEAVLSEPDLLLHRRLTKAYPAYRTSVILNPQKAQLCAFWDSVYLPSDAVLLMNDSQIAKWGIVT